jgi:hypothetical protein
MNFAKLLTLAGLVTLAGCAAAANQPTENCELMSAQICSRAAENQMNNGTLAVSFTPQRPNDAHVVPFVVPLFRPDNVLAAEVDCYANTDTHSYSIVRSDVAIQPSTQASIDFLENRHLCANQGSYANNALPAQQTLLPPPESDRTLLADTESSSH